MSRNRKVPTVILSQNEFKSQLIPNDFFVDLSLDTRSRYVSVKSSVSAADDGRFGNARSLTAQYSTRHSSDYSTCKIISFREGRQAEVILCPSTIGGLRAATNGMFLKARR